MKAMVRHVAKFTMLSSSGSGHHTVMDGRYHGEPPAASTPMEMLLMAAGSCTAIDIVNILEKRKTAFSDLSVEVTAESDPDEKNFYKIAHMHYHYSIHSEVPDEMLKKAIEMSLEKYCSVGMNIECDKSYTFEINS